MRHIRRWLGALHRALPLMYAAPASAQNKGVVGLYVSDLQTGDTLSSRGDELFPTASVIKLPILVELFHQIQRDGARWTDPLTLIDTSQAAGTN